MSTLTTDEPSLEKEFRGHKGTITAVAFNPTTTLLASSSLDNHVMLWHLRQGTRVSRLVGHKDGVMDICFSPSSNLVASASKDRTARLWVPTLKGDTSEIKAHMAPVRSVDFSPDGKHLLTSSDDKTVKLWAVTRRKFVSSFTGHTNWVRCAKFSPDGRLIASCGDDKMVKLFDVQNSQCVHTFPETKGYAISVVFHTSSTIIGTAMSNNVIKLYEIRTLKLLQQYMIHSGAVNKIAFHPCGNFLLSASQDSTMKVVDLLEGRPLYTLEGHESSPITAVSFSNNGEYFASGGADHQMFVWRSNFDREKLLMNAPVKKANALKETQMVPVVDTPVDNLLLQVDARKTSLGSTLPEIDVVSHDGNFHDGKEDKTKQQNDQKPTCGTSKSVKHHSMGHTVCSGLPAAPSIDYDPLAVQLHTFTRRLSEVVDLFIEKTTVLRSAIDEIGQEQNLHSNQIVEMEKKLIAIGQEQKLQNNKLVEIDAKLSGMKHIIDSCIRPIDAAGNSVIE